MATFQINGCCTDRMNPPAALVAYVRTVKTSSGATAVQIVWSSRRGSRSIERRRDQPGVRAACRLPRSHRTLIDQAPQTLLRVAGSPRLHRTDTNPELCSLGPIT